MEFIIKILVIFNLPYSQMCLQNTISFPGF